ncbi:uncharacterized protein MONOS_4321 [Monocercomonoides exilis]|uniref:uncharacterized protein n=1 Tax=Monocercomonoides exilis TaxID=2049356 RepID=UPI00355A8BBC|nr:hypothetical protein MONOS_4321 [Monocercomonoides exilis]|eukprot:MONOS_4321.1-p1 / transcript=MONOS_4321.1 / gene=MONOS_4321 / organism=Monocercomonoides_exilis_PA203 / gene_product=unspecified product / transcript_product=unspecified product / location=Mono_scaffold00113:93963-96731(-) / protein_length=923 / sequence_SO=supercontig / SO=protein_coding / is_pseudo=false
MDMKTVANMNSLSNLNSFSSRRENKKESKLTNKQISNTNEEMSNDDIKVDADGENGVDETDCGQSGKTPCKTIKKAIEFCKPKGGLSIYVAGCCHKYDTEPIVIDDCSVHISYKSQEKTIITTALEEKKVKIGETMFHVKNGGSFELRNMDICVDAKQESGRNQRFIIGEGEGTHILLNVVHFNNTNSELELNCVFMECKSGTLELIQVEISQFISSCALIFVEDAEEFHLEKSMLSSITTKSNSQSVITIMSARHFTSVLDCEFSNCCTIEHKLGGVIYLEIADNKQSSTILNSHFVNCTCHQTASYMTRGNARKNDESKGGAMSIRATDEVTDSISLSLKFITFSDCSADQGKFLFISYPVGTAQIYVKDFEFEMEEIYGKENLIIMEDRSEGKGNIVDLMCDGANRLTYHSKNLFIGGEKSTFEKTCGRKEEPCDLLSIATEHHTCNGKSRMMIIDSVNVGDPFSGPQYALITSAPDESSLAFPLTEQNRGILHIKADIKRVKTTYVFGGLKMLSFKHIDIEYPDAIEGDKLDLIYGKHSLEIVDVVFRPWKTDLQGDNVSGGEGKLLPLKLIIFEGEKINISQLVINGRNENNAKMNKTANSKIAHQSISQLNKERGILNGDNEKENPLCSWSSGLLELKSSSGAIINDSSFINIGEGAILSSSSKIELNNCSFFNNHPIDACWEKYPSLRYNIRQNGKPGIDYICIRSLTPGSDGLEGKPLGLLTNGKADGSAINGMNSFFFSQILKNVSLNEENKSAMNKMSNKDVSDSKVEAVVHGSYLFPCGLTFEASKKRNGKEQEWINCAVSEYVNETEMKVLIPRDILNVDDYTSVVCRLSYPAGVVNEEKKFSSNAILVKQKKEEPKKLTKAQLVAIIVSVSVFTVVAVAVTVVIKLFVIRNKKRRQYTSINDSELTNEV